MSNWAVPIGEAASSIPLLSNAAASDGNVTSSPMSPAAVGATVKAEPASLPVTPTGIRWLPEADEDNVNVAVAVPPPERVTVS